MFQKRTKTKSGSHPAVQLKGHPRGTSIVSKVLHSHIANTNEKAEGQKDPVNNDCTMPRFYPGQITSVLNICVDTF